MKRRQTQWFVIAIAIAVALYTAIRESGPEGDSAANSAITNDLPFDFWVLALSWSPAYCAGPDGASSPDQCGPGRDFGFITHGLWPQFEDGWPSFCQSPYGQEVPQETADALFPIMPDRGLIAHQWDKHGTCSGLSPEDYAQATMTATEAIQIPERFTSGSQLNLSAEGIEASFADANPNLDEDEVAVVCHNGSFTEVRICLNERFEPRACAQVDRNGCQQSGLTVLAP